MIPIARPLIGEEEKMAVMEVLDSGVIAQGERVRGFEEAFAAYIGTPHAVATNNGTTALHTALLACGIKGGDEVITTPFTFIASANSILYCGGRPVFADINPGTFNIDPEAVKEKITSRTRALLVVHLYGQPCDMDAIKDICQDHRLKLIEDACQAHGAEYKGKKVGTFGDAACFSFYPTKNMTTGEGGMITTRDAGVAGKCRLLREHGSSVRYYHDTLGYNYRMTDMAAALGIEQLKRLDGFNNERIDNAGRLTRGLQGARGIETPLVDPDVKHVFHQYTVKVEDRDAAIRKLEKGGIGYGIYYPVPVHRQRLYRDYADEKLPSSEEAAGSVLSLPVHPGVSEEDVEHIVRILG